MPGFKTTAARWRLSAYVILTIAVAVALLLTNNEINKINRERASRIKQNSSSQLQLCKGINGNRYILRKIIRSSLASAEKFDEQFYVKKFHILTQAAFDELKIEAKRQEKIEISQLSYKDCSKLPVIVTTTSTTTTTFPKGVSK